MEEVSYRLRKLLDNNTEIIKVINENVNKLPFVISIPHSGLYITKEMNKKLNNVILANMDWYLPELFEFLEKLGFTMVINNISRYVIDPNRDINITNNESYTKSLIYKKTTFDREMYKIPLNKKEIEDRIKRFYENYHNTLNRLIAEKLKWFNKVYLIDLHSFGKQIESDVVLGNDNGNTMNKELVQYINNLFVYNGFSVSVNNPFNGGYITKHYGKTHGKCESLQIELSYFSYIDKRKFYEEEFSYINKDVMNDCQLRLQKIFEKIIKIY